MNTYTTPAILPPSAADTQRFERAELLESYGLPENLADVYAEGLPELAPELITGVLRRGHKMLIAGASKAYKSFALIELAVSLAEGRPWLGFQCQQVRVLYLNLEIDRASFLGRLDKVYNEIAPEKTNAGNIDVFHLRGKVTSLKDLVDYFRVFDNRLNYSAIIIDPIYKILNGDENSAADIGQFCNLLDNLTEDTGAAVIYCHHYSKGAQGGKRAIDRASGSGVFGRDPDAVITFSELELKEDATNWLWKNYESIDPAWRSPNKDNPDYRRNRNAYIERVTGWRLEFTLREFASPSPLDAWFRYPVHIVDRKGVLESSVIDGSQTAQERQQEQFYDDIVALENAVIKMGGGNPVRARDLESATGASYNAIKNRVKHSEILTTAREDPDNPKSPLLICLSDDYCMSA